MAKSNDEAKSLRLTTAAGGTQSGSAVFTISKGGKGVVAL
jgi:hypothetical protein